MILYMPVPQTEHLPLIAGRPFFMVTFSVSFIGLFCLHFTQYASSAISVSFRLLEIVYHKYGAVLRIIEHGNLPKMNGK